MVKIKIMKANEKQLDKLHLDGKEVSFMPKKAFDTSAGADVHAWIEAPMKLYPKETKVIPAGFKMEIPAGYEAQIRSRSGLALSGIIVANQPGTIDSEYRGEVGVILRNNSKQMVIIRPGDRIAQMVINELPKVEFEMVGELTDTERKDGGFGSTGVAGQKKEKKVSKKKEEKKEPEAPESDKAPETDPEDENKELDTKE